MDEKKGEIIEEQLNRLRQRRILEDSWFVVTLFIEISVHQDWPVLVELLVNKGAYKNVYIELEWSIRKTEGLEVEFIQLARGIYVETDVQITWLG